jgi:NAD(P)-dependent dehydrogenase (short-subunit alcohol dehydrogenase family)
VSGPYRVRWMAANQDGAVVVTGASTGIGRASALLLDERGYEVFAGVRKESDAESLRAEGSERLTPITIDVTEEDSIRAAREQVEAAVGERGLAGLVNNAGVGSGGPIEYLPVEEFRKAIEVNLIGQVAVTQAFLPLIRKGQGTIAFIASIGGRIASPFMSPYNASKFGIEAVGDSLRREVSPWEIDVVVVEPGSIATEIWRKGSEKAAELQSGIPPEGVELYGTQIERFGDALQETAARGIPPREVAEVVHKAIRSGRPRPRYLVGTDAKIGAKVHAVLPKRVFDRLVRRQMKLPRRLPSDG